MTKIRKYSHIEMRTDTVIKTGRPDLLEIEVEKMRRAWAIGRRCGLFRVPEVLDFDKDAGRCVFERIRNMRPATPLCKAIAWGKPYQDFAHKLGKAISVVHRELQMPKEMLHVLPDFFKFRDKQVVLHGDLSTKNVNVSMDRMGPTIVIIDWQMTPLYGGKSSYGTPYFDLLWFIANLVFTPYTRFLFSDPVKPVVLSFIRGYFEETGLVFNSDLLGSYARRFFEVEEPRYVAEIRRNSRGRARIILPRCVKILHEIIRLICASNTITS